MSVASSRLGFVLSRNLKSLLQAVASERGSANGERSLCAVLVLVAVRDLGVHWVWPTAIPDLKARKSVSCSLEKVQCPQDTFTHLEGGTRRGTEGAAVVLGPVPFRAYVCGSQLRRGGHREPVFFSKDVTGHVNYTRHVIYNDHVSENRKSRETGSHVKPGSARFVARRVSSILFHFAITFIPFLVRLHCPILPIFARVVNRRGKKPAKGTKTEIQISLDKRVRKRINPTESTSTLSISYTCETRSRPLQNKLDAGFTKSLSCVASEQRSASRLFCNSISRWLSAATHVLRGTRTYIYILNIYDRSPELQFEFCSGFQDKSS